MSSTSANNKRIAKNTIIVYVRLIIVTIIGLLTSRLVLQRLGVSDYGLYSVVGGVITMFSVISGSMSGTTIRFLNYAKFELLLEVSCTADVGKGYNGIMRFT